MRYFWYYIIYDKWNDKIQGIQKDIYVDFRIHFTQYNLKPARKIDISAIIVPNINQKTTLIKIEKLMSEIEGTKISHIKSSVSANVTASFGVITVDNVSQFMTNEKILKYADSCLYQAKEQGRNKYISLQI